MMIKKQNVIEGVILCIVFLLTNNSSPKSPEEHFFEQCEPLLCKEQCQSILKTYKKAEHDTQELKSISKKIGFIAVKKRYTSLHGFLDITCEEYVTPLIEQAKHIVETGLPNTDTTYASLLEAAVTANCPDFVQWLLDHNISPNTVDENGTPVLTIAASTNASGAVQTLLDGGANISHKSAAGLTALDLARLNDNANIATILTNHTSQSQTKK